MAWDPNEPGNPAWMSKQASEHGGVENYLKNIEDNAKAEQKEKDMEIIKWVIGGALFVGAGCYAAGNKIYRCCINIKNRKKLEREERQQKAEESKEALVSIVNEETDDDTVNQTTTSM